MTSPPGVVVLRPEPGGTRTKNMLRDHGVAARAVPFFAVVPVAWEPPDPARYDALLLTSANAVRHGGAGLEALKPLPVVAVGAATADAARETGFAVAVTGAADARSAIAVARAQGFARLLHLSGRERADTVDAIGAIIVYASDPLPIDDAAIRAFAGDIVLLHSARAARLLAERVDAAGVARATIRLVAISPAVADAAGPGWGHCEAAPSPDDAALVAVAVALAAACAATRAIDPAPRGGDKRIMSDYPPIDRPQQHRKSRPKLLVILVALAFVAGLALMGYAMRRTTWFGGTTATAPTAMPKTVAGPAAGNSDFTPAQPLNANGEAPAAAPIDTAVLATREATLAGQLAALETRTAAVTIDAAAAAGQATRAEGLMVAFAARRAIDRGVGLGYLEEQLRLRFGQAQPRATGAVIQAAHQPVTIEDLRQGLDAIAPEITSGTAGDWADDWFASVRREFGNLVVLREASTPSPMPADRLARARRLLEGGQVEAARAEIARLPGAAQAGNWLEAARRYVVARQALDVIENAALLGQPGQPQPVPVVLTAPMAMPEQPAPTP